MFDLLTQVLLWALIGLVVWYLLSNVIRASFYTAIGVLAFALLVIGALVEPNAGIVGEIWGLISLPFRPLGLALILLALDLNWNTIWKVRETVQKRVAWTLVILWICGMPITAYALSTQLETEVVNRVERTAADQAPVLVLLAQDTTEPGIPPRTQVQLTEGGNRIRYAAQLVRNDPTINTVIVSAGPRPSLSGGEDADRREVKDAVIVLVENILGRIDGRLIEEIRAVVSDPSQPLLLPDGVAIIVDRNSNTIYQSAQATRRILNSETYGLQNVRSIFLVASALHAIRATATFEKTFEDIRTFNVIPKVTNFHAIQSVARQPSYSVQIADLIPYAPALARTSRIIEEQLISIYYFLRGWLASTS